MARAFNSWRLEIWYYIYIVPSLWWKDIKELFLVFVSLLIFSTWAVKGCLMERREIHDTKSSIVAVTRDVRFWLRRKIGSKADV